MRDVYCIDRFIRRQECSIGSVLVWCEVVSFRTSVLFLFVGLLAIRVVRDINSVSVAAQLDMYLYMSD